MGFGGGDVNLYAYVGNQPIDWVDPSGLFQLQFDPDTDINDKKFIENAFAQLHDRVKDNQSAIDYFKKFGNIEIDKDSIPGQGPVIQIGINKCEDAHGRYVDKIHMIVFYKRSFINDTRALYTVGHELAHWARDIYGHDVDVQKFQPLKTPHVDDGPYGYGAEMAIFGNVLWPNGTFRK